MPCAQDSAHEQAAAKPPGTGLRRLPPPDPPRHPADCTLLTLTLILQVQGCKPRNKPYLPITLAIASTSSSPVTGLRRKPPMPAASTCC
ncbi:hypothetical protein D5301_11610 [Stenotrophomonas sp. MH181796]|nr:hypothetical protein [Stenotrophomonas maltophilia]MBA0325060.1 hypothetical protein [Stenotrophomonas maltophilia]MRI42880.1 hypothetical protein [Stenotrophomonas sp. MH181796]